MMRILLGLLRDDIGRECMILVHDVGDKPVGQKSTEILTQGAETRLIFEATLEQLYVGHEAAMQLLMIGQPRIARGRHDLLFAIEMGTRVAHQLVEDKFD